MIDTLRQATIVNSVLLNKRQQLFIKYHPICILNHDHQIEHKTLDDNLNKQQIAQILEEDDENELSKIDRELFYQLIETKQETRDMSSSQLHLD